MITLLRVDFDFRASEANQAVVRESDVLGWLSDSKAYMGAWPTPFPLEEGELTRGASLRVWFAGAVPTAFICEGFGFHGNVVSTERAVR